MNMIGLSDVTATEMEPLKKSYTIAGKTLSQIKTTLKPLDIIVWRGHMMVVYDENHTIESAVSYPD